MTLLSTHNFNVLLKGKQVLSIQFTGSSYLIHFEDLVMEVKEPNIRIIQERISWSQAKELSNRRARKKSID